MDEEKSGSEKNRTLNEMDGLCPGSYWHFLEPGSLPMDKPEESHSVFCTAWTNRPTVPETGVEPPKLRFADEFVHSPFLKMSSCFSFRASMNKVVPARSCHRAYILNYIVESRTVTVSPTELYLIRI